MRASVLEKITSPSNPLVKRLKALHAKKGRAETGLFLAEGARLASEAAELGIWPEVMAVSGQALERPQVRALVNAAERENVRVIETSENLLSQIAKRDNPQTVIGAYRNLDVELNALGGDFLVALDHVRDPGNLGTILRTCDCATVTGVVLVGQTCDPYSVEAVRASMGSIFAMKFARTSFDAFDTWRRAQRYFMVGASLKGEVLHDAFEARQKLILLMGNEQSGLGADEENACDALVRIPMRGRADSLNLAAATAVLTYDVWRRRGYA